MVWVLQPLELLNFAAASGSSLATTGTMGAIASKEMDKSGYDNSFSAGTIVAGGGL